MLSHSSCRYRSVPGLLSDTSVDRIYAKHCGMDSIADDLLYVCWGMSPLTLLSIRAIVSVLSTLDCLEEEDRNRSNSIALAFRMLWTGYVARNMS